MKPLLFSLLFLLIPKIGFSQVSKNNELELSPNDRFFYLDSISQETTSKDYVYIRVIKDSKLKKDTYAVQEYYRSGAMRMEGISKTYDGYSKEGNVFYYYKNGNKKSTANYIKGRVNGKDNEWYENGTKKLEGEFIEDEKKRTTQHKINQFWDVNGVQKVIDGNGFFEDKGENEYSKGEIKNGFKEGDWEGTLVKLNVNYKEKYSDGKFISGTTTDKNGIQTTYNALEKKPEPKDGINNFYQYIGKNFNISRLPNGLKGKIYVTFVVDKNGKIIEPILLRDIGYGSGEEALRLVANAENWIPGEQRGIKVKVKYSLPITIQSAN